MGGKEVSHRTRGCSNERERAAEAEGSTPDTPSTSARQAHEASDQRRGPGN